MTRNVYLIGTAGSGKTTFTHAFRTWMQSQGLDAITVNLDPGAERLPYDPEVDIRDWIRLEEIMDEQGLGPNGAQVVAADMLALNAKADLLSPEQLEEVVKWSLDPFALYDALVQGDITPKTTLDVSFFESLETIGVYKRLVPVSSEAVFGFEDVYAAIQMVFEGGEDMRPD